MNQSFFKASQANEWKSLIGQEMFKQNEPILLFLGYFLVSGSLFNMFFVFFFAVMITDDAFFPKLKRNIKIMIIIGYLFLIAPFF